MGIGPGHGSREEKPDALILFSCYDIVGVTLNFLTQIFNFFFTLEISADLLCQSECVSPRA